MACQEQQKEELEVLQSIYDGDPNFKQTSPTNFQYKFGEDSSYRSFLVELQWGYNYPEEPATVNLDLFYNKHIVDSVREAIRSGLENQMAELCGTPMTFTLFEWMKDNLDTLLANQPDAPITQVAGSESSILQAGDSNGGSDQPVARKEKKEHLSKQQKRRMLDKYGANMGERPRGWDWVDVIKHLSQTGGKPEDG